MIKNRTIFTGDNLDILRGMDDESIDLIYLDPPFNSNRNHSAPIGSEAAGAAFKDAWTLDDVDDAWAGQLAHNHYPLYRAIDAAGAVGGRGDRAYLIYMAVRILEMYRLLSGTASFYYHCDSTMSHSVKMMLDAIFGKNNFQNEIIWHYDGPQRPSKKRFGSKHDVIFRYSKSLQYFVNPLGIAPPTVISIEDLKKYKKNKTGKYYYTLPRGDYTDKSIKKLEKENRIEYTSTGKARIIYYLDTDAFGVTTRNKQLHDVWSDIPSLGHINSIEKTGFPTQKPRALMERIIKASCPENGKVLDPFCGCATTPIAAEILGREWIGIDISPKAVSLIKTRAAKELGSLFEVIHRIDIPVIDAPKPSRNIKEILYGKQHGLCNGCKVHFPYVNFTIDHIIPVSKNGPDTDKNLQLLCGHCNSKKGNRPMEYLLAEIKKR